MHAGTAIWSGVALHPAQAAHALRALLRRRGVGEVCRHFSPDLQRTRRQRWLCLIAACRAHQLGRGLWLWRSLGHGHGPDVLGRAVASSPSASLGGIVVAVLAELFARRPADTRAARGDVAQQEVEVVAAPVVKDHWDDLGRLGAPRYRPVELLLGGLEGCEALPAVSGGPVLPPSPGEVVVGRLGRSVSDLDRILITALEAKRSVSDQGKYFPKRRKDPSRKIRLGPG